MPAPASQAVGQKGESVLRDHNLVTDRPHVLEENTEAQRSSHARVGARPGPRQTAPRVASRRSWGRESSYPFISGPARRSYLVQRETRVPQGHGWAQRAGVLGEGATSPESRVSSRGRGMAQVGRTAPHAGACTTTNEMDTVAIPSGSKQKGKESGSDTFELR